METHERSLLHIKQAARAIDVHESTIRRAIHSGHLRALRCGPTGHYRIREADLQEFLVEAKP